MKKSINVTIGIPAYNESANIKQLLVSLLSQIEDGYRIIEIIVISDGSTDTTDDLVRSILNKKIKLISGSKRSGKSARVNQILRLFRGDLLLLLDADIIVKDNQLILKIIKNTNLERSGLIGINARPYESKNFFQKIMESGVSATYDVGKMWNKGNNYLLFKGCFLGLSKSFAKSIEVPTQIINNDAYLYFAAIEKGFRPEFIENANVYFKSPKNFSDHIKQSGRFKTSKSEMQKYFKYDLSREYCIPKSIYTKASLNRLFSNHVYFLGYLVVNLLSKLKRTDHASSVWNIAESTKK